jgi:NAD(P)H-dependent nitrite reductase small subunit
LTKNSNRLSKTDEEEFTFICTLDDLQENRGRRFTINDVEIALFKIDFNVYALSNICPHQQTHLIYEGFVENNFVVCPAHGWEFNLKTGKKPSGSNGLSTYPVKVKNDRVYVKVQPKTFNW